MENSRQFKKINTVGKLKEFLKDAPDNSEVFSNNFMHSLYVRYLEDHDGKPLLDVRIKKEFYKSDGN